MGVEEQWDQLLVRSQYRWPKGRGMEGRLEDRMSSLLGLRLSSKVLWETCTLSQYARRGGRHRHGWACSRSNDGAVEAGKREWCTSADWCYD
jgi:hypothetical protein